MKVPSLLKNKYVFYGLAVLAVMNVVGYVSVRAYECLALFVWTAYSAHCYCKNESCSILAALFVANFVFGCGRVKEGFEDAIKGPVEHLEDASNSIEAASGCSDTSLTTKKLCEEAKDANDAALNCAWTNNSCGDPASNTGGSGSSGGSGPV